MRYGKFVSSENESIDEVMAVVMPAGQSYTGLSQAEIFCHGGRQVASLILDEIVKSGARTAEPGEFTKLAFLSGKIDLSKAEAVAEIISANTEQSYRAAREHLLGNYSKLIDDIYSDLISLLAQVEASIDFPEEELSPNETKALLKLSDKNINQISSLLETYKGGKIIKEGFKIALAGKTNAGKSSLFNQLLKEQRAIVAPTEGTTRDFLSEWIDIDGYAINIIDTAGIRKDAEHVEKIGQESAKKIIEDSDLTLWMFDQTDKDAFEKAHSNSQEIKAREILLVANKSDLISSEKWSKQSNQTLNIVETSCKTGEGIKELQRKILEIIRANAKDSSSGVIVTSRRHQKKLKAALSHLRIARKHIEVSESPDITAFELRMGANELEEITGRIYNEQILGEIFSKFCIGK